MRLSVKHLIIFFLLPAFLRFFVSCSASKNIQRFAQKNLISDSVLMDAHIGVAVIDASTNKPIYKHNSNKFFVPASNTKIITLYAGLKYLGDSLPGIRYEARADSIILSPTGDPSFLHPDFPKQPVFDFLKKQTRPIAISTTNWKTDAYGEGWMWDDYSSGYMAERSPFPVYGNVIRWNQVRDSGSISALARQEAFIYSEPDISWKVNFSSDTGALTFSAKRSQNTNAFFITQGKEPNITIEVPFITYGLTSGLELLKDSLLKTIDTTSGPVNATSIIHSQPVDSLFKLMMHRSDNFFAEQTLMMVSGERYGIIDEKKLIADLLHNDLKEFPQAPVWADGSGLSRYNLFTPEDYVWLLNKLKHEFGLERLKKILPTGGTGTLLNYYKNDSTFIFAKTGTLSAVVALSGYLYGKSGKLLLFSVLVNNHTQAAWKIRRKVEAFLEKVREEN
ncbi:MAG: D-alanyl-D-alanine carboxypeptidase [Chitinophagaceae bacterium]|nr:D-alanyl-D-alanine carboxypeptidase [Chitinophagaceae bacterium]